ncbi:MAG: hypothetical protein OSB03_14540 [Vicinamibacterales bacterium]|nr:hypothetical protein [Vicinamibacterales bacterium]
MGQGYVLAWAYRDGTEEVLPRNFPPSLLRTNGGPNTRVSPSVGSVAITMVTDGQDDIWKYDTSLDTLEPVTTHPADDTNPRWTPDEEGVVFSSTRDGGDWGLFTKRANGTGEATLLLNRPGVLTLAASTWSPDGTMLVFSEQTTDTGWDVWMLSMDGDPAPRVLTRTPDDERAPSISPDGNWIAYTSNRSGQREVYVDRLPNTGQPERISRDGGSVPQWSADGRELTFRTRVFRQLSGVSFDPESGAFSPEEVVLEGNYAGTDYGADPNGVRFLVVKQAGAPTEVDARNDIVVVQNWFDELQRLVPTP